MHIRSSQAGQREGSPWREGQEGSLGAEHGRTPEGGRMPRGDSGQEGQVVGTTEHIQKKGDLVSRGG